MAETLVGAGSGDDTLERAGDNDALEVAPDTDQDTEVAAERRVDRAKMAPDGSRKRRKIRVQHALAGFFSLVVDSLHEGEERRVGYLHRCIRYF